MMDFDIIDPKTGKTHIIPYKDLPDALQSGGEFADEEQQKRALFYQEQEKQSQKPRTAREYGQELVKSIPGGVGQGLVNALVSIGNLPSDAYQFATGKEGYHIPKTHFAEKDFPSGAERMGTSIGEIGGGFLAPGGAILGGTMKAAKAIPFIKNAPLALRAAIGGGLSGAALNEDNRGVGGAIGAALSGSGPAAYAGGKFLSTKPEAPARLAQDIYKAAKKKASEAFDSLENRVVSENISGFKAPKEVFKVAEEYLKSASSKAAIDSAKKGNFKGLREVESKLGKAYREKLSKGEMTAAEQIDEARKMIIDSYGKRFESGHEELGDLLSDAKSQWKHLKDVFEKDASIRNIVSRHRKIPSDPLKKFGEKSDTMDRLKAEYPEIQEAFKKALRASKIRTGLTGAGILGTTLKGVHSVWDLLG